MDAYHATRDQVSKNPEAGRGSFETVTHWRDDAQAVTKARSFTIETAEPAEPAALGGKVQPIDPMDLLLAAVGTCLTIGRVTQANMKGMQPTGAQVAPSVCVKNALIAPDKRIPATMPNVTH